MADAVAGGHAGRRAVRDGGADARGGYAFIHDRVQQAAYALIPEDERPGVHLGVGRQLLAEVGGRVTRLFPELCSDRGPGA